MFDVSNKEINQVHAPDANIRNGLIMLIELAAADFHQGFSLEYIAEKNRIPQEDLVPVASKLEQIGLIVCNAILPDRFCLKEEPGCKWIIEMVSVLKQHF